MATIIRIAHERGPFVVIDRRAIEDERLSWAARGILAYLLAKPDDWTLRVTDLRRKGNLGRDALYRVIKELMANGYIERRAERDAKGRMTQNEYVVYEVPKTVLPDPDTPNLAAPTSVRRTLPNNKSTKDPVNQASTTAPSDNRPIERRSGDGSSPHRDEPDAQAISNVLSADAPPSTTRPTEDPPTVTDPETHRGRWFFPSSFTKAECNAALRKLEGLPPTTAQALLDELTGRMLRHLVRASPLGYLRVLIESEHQGEFTPELGLAVQEARLHRASVERAIEAQSAKAPSLPPPDPDHPIAQRVEAIRAKPRTTETARAACGGSQR